jgi:hypothetical protein
MKTATLFRLNGLQLLLVPLAVAAPSPAWPQDLGFRKRATGPDLPYSAFQKITCTNPGVTDASLYPSVRWADVQVVRITVQLPVSWQGTLLWANLSALMSSLTPGNM